MKKQLLSLLIICPAAAFLVACSAGHAVHDMLADASMRKCHLANGRPVSIGTNVIPTASWGCQEIGVRQAYSWYELRKEAMLRFNAPEGILMEKALNYANMTGLQPNYINALIPNKKSSSINIMGFGRTRSAPMTTAFAVYYQCERINPNKQIGYTTETRSGFSIN